MTDVPTKTINRRAKKPGLPLDRVRKLVIDWLNMGHMASQFLAQAETTKLLLRDDILVGQGEVDEKGSYWIYFDEEDPIPDPAGKGAVKAIKRQRSESKALNAERAEELLRKKGLWDDCTEEVTEVVLNEEAILAAAYEKKLTDKELASIYDVKETWSFVPQRLQ